MCIVTMSCSEQGGSHTNVCNWAHTHITPPRVCLHVCGLSHSLYHPPTPHAHATKGLIHAGFFSAYFAHAGPPYLTHAPLFMSKIELIHAGFFSVYFPHLGAPYLAHAPLSMSKIEPIHAGFFSAYFGWPYPLFLPKFCIYGRFFLAYLCWLGPPPYSLLLNFFRHFRAN